MLFQIGAALLLQNGADLLQIGAGISNRGRFISNRGSYFKSGQLFQIGAEHMSTYSTYGVSTGAKIAFSI